MKINIIDILEGLTKFTDTYFRCFLFLSPHATSALKIESQTKEQGHTLHQLLSTESAVLFPGVKLWDLQGWFPVPTASLHWSRAQQPPLTPDPQPSSGPWCSQAALQHPWNAFSNPFAVHWVPFYYQRCFTVPNSQISSGSHSLSMVSVTSLVSVSSACPGEDGKGHRCPRSPGLPDQTSTLLSPSYKALHEKKSCICVVPNLFSAHFSWSRHICWTCQSALCRSCHLCSHPTSALGFNI